MKAKTKWRWAAAVACMLAAGPAAGSAGARVRYVANPVPDPRGGPLSCPDPSVEFASPSRKAWEIACTTDFGEANGSGNGSAAYTLYKSGDFIHWQPDGFVFGPGHEPNWALRSVGTNQGGRYWAPEIHRIGGQWVVYFATQVKPQILERLTHASVKPGTFVLGVASGPTVHGPWKTHVLHYIGQFNGVPGNKGTEWKGGAIDPTEVQDPRTGLRYLFWTKQPNQVWVGQLSSDGLVLQPHVRLAFLANASHPWECDAGGHCVIEGPSAYAAPDGTIRVLFSAASTWDGTYKVGVAATSDPMTGSFDVDPSPILSAGNGLVGPGGESQPIIGPGGATYLFFHVQIHATHASQARYLAIGMLHDDGAWPIVDDGHPGRRSAVVAGGGALQVIDLSGP